MKKIALLSVYNKEGIVDFAHELVALGWEIISSGGTSKALVDAGISVTDVSDITGMKAILSHRVVTLHPKIHGGLLALNTPEHLAELEKYEIPWIDMVCCDLYPLAEEIEKVNSTRESVIEKTDMGGPAMTRSSAKGGRITICDPADRPLVIDWLKAGEPDREIFIQNLSAKAEYIISKYIFTSAKYLSKGTYEGFIGEKIAECKYGENAYQTPAGVYSVNNCDPLSVENFKLISGTAPSYNNYCDLDRMLTTITHIAGGYDVNYGKVPKIAIAVKHGNACGAAVGENEKEVLEKMIMGDPRAIFGGLVMTNFPIDEGHAESLLSYNMPEGVRRILDGIIAPDFAESAIAVLKRKGDKCRFLANEALLNLTKNSLDKTPRFRYVRGGFFMQPNYSYLLDLKQTELAKHGSATEAQERDMILSSAIGHTSNSNTIALVREGQLIGNGVGQQDRVGACGLAISRAVGAGHNTQGAVAYSDSFFPFPDAPEVLIKNGISAIFSTSGSVNDVKAIDVCAKANVPLYLIPDTLGRGFFGH